MKKAKRILIKPNLVTDKPSHKGVTTDIKLIQEIIGVLKETTSAELLVGESSLINTEDVFKNLNIHSLENLGCRVINFDKNSWISVQPPFNLLFNNLLIPKVALESDVIINVSKMKTHQLTGVSLGIKNFLGLLSRGGRKYAHLKDINKGIADIYSYFEKNKKVISIIDGIISLSGKFGPIKGTPIKTDLLIASANTIIADAAAVAIMGAVPSHIRHIRLASELFNDRINLPDLKISPFYDNNIKFELPLITDRPVPKAFKFIDLIYNKFFYKYPVQISSQLCLSCKKCEILCPINSAKVNGTFFSYKPSDCIHCLCCVEACESGAISYKVNNEKLFFILRYLRRRLKASKKHMM